MEKARSYPPEGDEVYLEGVGQEQPFDDNVFDAVTFFNSLHHVPLENMAGALVEAIEDDLRSAFERLGIPDEQGVRFDQPMRVNVLQKV